MGATDLQAARLFQRRIALDALFGGLIGFIIGFRPGGGMVGVVAALGLILVFSFALSWLWIIVGMLMKTPETVMTMSFVFLMPLTFASDIFVRLETMPGWLQAVVGRNPVTLLARIQFLEDQNAFVVSEVIFAELDRRHA